MNRFTLECLFEILTGTANNKLTMMFIVAALLLIIGSLFLLWEKCKTFDPKSCVINPICFKDVVAGTPIKFNIELLNFINFAVGVEQNILDSQAFKLKIYKQDNVPKTIPVHFISRNVNVCHVEVVLESAYKETVMGTLFYKNEIIGQAKQLKLKIKPGPLAKIAFQEEYKFTRHKYDSLQVSLTGQDQYGNSTSIDNNQWYLEGTDANGAKAVITQSASSQTYDFSFEREGTFRVRIKSKALQNNISLPGDFPVNVIPAPLQPKKCEVSIVKRKFDHESPSVRATFQIKLLDILSEPFCSSRFVKEHLIIKIKNEPAQLDATTFEIDKRRNTTQNRENVIFLDVEMPLRESSADSVLQFFYKSKPLGTEFQIIVPLVTIPYLKETYIEETSVHSLRVYDIPRSKLLGEDGDNLTNINRVLKVEALKFDDFQQEDNSIVTVDISRLPLEKHKLFLFIFSLLIQGIHYRNEGRELDKERIRWRNKAMEAYETKYFQYSKECRIIKEKYSKLIDDANFEASETIFRFFNIGRTPVREIDLHGQLVVEENRLDQERQKLLRTKSESDVNEIIEEWREKSDEAIRHLRRAIENKADRDWFEIIVGAGHHSRNNKQKIRPKVEKFLHDEGIPFKECNKGSLLITFKEYDGDEPCFGSFYCKKSERSWESACSWKGYWQNCNHCNSKCYPMKLSRTPTTQTSQSNQRNRSSVDHRRHCQKCIETGMDCRIVN